MELFWLQVRVADELAATNHLSAEEFGVLTRLKFHLWKNETLPIDDRRLARIAGISDERWPEIRAVVSKFFDGEWRNAALDALRREAEEIHAKRVAAGKKGGRPRNSDADEKAGVKPGFSGEEAGPKPGFDSAKAGPKPGLSNYSYINTGKAAQDKEPTRTREKDGIPTANTRQEAQQWLSGQEVFPGNPQFDALVSKMLRGTLRLADIAAAKKPPKNPAPGNSYSRAKSGQDFAGDDDGWNT